MLCVAIIAMNGTMLTVYDHAVDRALSCIRTSVHKLRRLRSHRPIVTQTGLPTVIIIIFERIYVTKGHAQKLLGRAPLKPTASITRIRNNKNVIILHEQDLCDRHWQFELKR
jgi:hypothetical protein